MIKTSRPLAYFMLFAVAEYFRQFTHQTNNGMPSIFRESYNNNSRVGYNIPQKIQIVESR